MRILITGSTGFVGRHVVNALQGSENKLALLVPSIQEALHLQTTNTVLIAGILEDIDTIKDSIQKFLPQVCIHLAWQGIPDYSAEISKLNLDCSIKLVDFLTKETDCKKFIFSGSCFEYGKIQGECKESESTTISSYIAWAKQSLFNYASLLCAQASIDLIWFRIFYVYGPGQRKKTLIPTLVQSFKHGTKPEINNPLNKNDFIYVGDVAEAFHLATITQINSGIYNLGSGSSNSVYEVCKIVEEQIQRSIKVSEEIKKKCIKQGEVNFWADMTKTIRVLNWSPKTSLEQGIIQYIKSSEQMNMEVSKNTDE